MSEQAATVADGSTQEHELGNETDTTPAATSTEEKAESPPAVVSVDGSSAADAEDGLEGQSSQSTMTMNNMNQLLKKPFEDVLKDAMTNLKLKSSAHQAAEQLRCLLHHDSSHCEELLASPVLQLLSGIVRESPGIPASGSAMAVLAMLALHPEGRAALRAEGVMPAVVKFLSMAGFLTKPNADPALLLLQNASCDKLIRQILNKADSLNVLLELLANNITWLKQHPNQAGPITGTLANLVVADSDNPGSARQRFVKTGGIEVVCKVLQELGRYDRSPSTARLQLLLNEISNSPQYTIRVQEAAANATPSHSFTGATVAQPASGSQAATVAAGQLSAMSALLNEASALAKGVVLGSPRMPASDRIATAVLSNADGHVALVVQPAADAAS